MIYGFCSSNTLYSASPSFRMLIFLLAPFDTCNCYYFESDFNLVPLIKVSYTKKANNVIFSFLDITLKNDFEIILSYELLCLTRISLRQY